MMNMKNMLGMSGRSMSDGRVRMSNGGSSIGGFMGMNANMGSMLAKNILGEKVELYLTGIELQQQG